MRKLHLLLAEWRFEQRIIERRFCSIFQTNLAKTEGVEFDKHFPFLFDDGEEVSTEQPDDLDGQIFSQAKAALGA